MCGQCFVVCPQNAKQIVDETEKVKVLLQSGAPVVVSLAPSFVANYEVGIEAMREAIKKLGFYDVEETAIGATIVKREYERLVKDEGTGYYHNFLLSFGKFADLETFSPLLALPCRYNVSDAGAL